MFEVSWSGRYPCLCFGEWTIKKNGVDVSDFIPDELRDREMNTKKAYSHWHFDGDWREVWEEVTEGMDEDEWIERNDWIKNICDTREEMAELYAAIREEDWVHSSCGGCI